MTAQRITKRMVRCAQVQLQRVHHVGWRCGRLRREGASHRDEVVCGRL